MRYTRRMSRARHAHRDALRQSVFFIFILLVMGACDTTSSTPKPLRLGVGDWPGDAPLYGAANFGYFGPAQVEMKGFTANFDRSRAFAEGRLELVATTLFDALRL